MCVVRSAIVVRAAQSDRGGCRLIAGLLPCRAFSNVGGGTFVMPPLPSLCGRLAASPLSIDFPVLLGGQELRPICRALQQDAGHEA
jgi:hypothetical protein